MDLNWSSCKKIFCDESGGYIIWDNASVDFGACFENVVAPSVCLFFVSILFCFLWFIRRKYRSNANNGNIEYPELKTARRRQLLVCSVLALWISIYTLIGVLTTTTVFHSSLIFNSLILIDTLVFITLCLVRENEKTRQLYWIVKVFWVISVVLFFLRLQTVVRVYLLAWQNFISNGGLFGKSDNGVVLFKIPVGFSDVCFDVGYIVFFVGYLFIAVLDFIKNNFDYPSEMLSEKLLSKEENLERIFPQSSQPSPECTASFFSYVTFSWLQSLIARGKKFPLTRNDLYDLPKKETSKKLNARISYLWDQETKESKLKDRKRSILRVLIKAHRVEFSKGALLKFFYDISLFVGPVCLNRIVDYLSFTDNSKNQNVFYGLNYVLLLFLVSVFQTICLQQYFHRMFLIGMRVRSSLCTLVYGKALKCLPGCSGSSNSFVENNSGKQQQTTEGVCIMSVDIRRLQDLVTYLNILWSSPLQITITLFFLYNIIGISMIGGLLVMLFSITFTWFVSRKVRVFQNIIMNTKDKRLGITTEVLNSMKTVKLYGWEESFEKDITNIRSQELRGLWRYQLLSIYLRVQWLITPICVALATFALYVFFGNNLTATVAFTSLSLFNILRFPTQVLPSIVTLSIEAAISITRINNFMNASQVNSLSNESGTFLLNGKFEDNLRNNFRDSKIEDHYEDSEEILLQNNVISDLYKEFGLFVSESEIEESDDEMVRSNDASLFVKSKKQSYEAIYRSLYEQKKLIVFFKDASFTWPNNDYVLRNVNLKLLPGSITSVIGYTGSGKSGLLWSILGDCKCVQGFVASVGRIAYCSQIPFIINASVRENIVFHEPYNEQKYAQVVHMTCLLQDFHQFPVGDKTEIGERGFNLSGGQKQRISLARALYSDADIYLLDDILSSCDADVGNMILNRCFCSFLKSKIVISVTHRLDALHLFDNIIFFNNKEIIFNGTYRDLVQFPDFNKFSRKQNLEFFEQKQQQMYDESLPYIKNLFPYSEKFVPRAFQTSLENNVHSGMVSDSVNSNNNQPTNSDEPVNEPVDLNQFSNVPIFVKHELKHENVRVSSNLTSSMEEENFDFKNTEFAPEIILEKIEKCRLKINDANVVTEETLGSNVVDARSYKTYLSGAGGLKMAIGIVLAFAVNSIAQMAANLMLSYWTDHPNHNVKRSLLSGVDYFFVTGSMTFLEKTNSEYNNNNHVLNNNSNGNYELTDRYYGLYLYALSCLIQIISSLFSSFLVAVASQLAAKKFHELLLNSVLSAPMTFFYSNPVGRILNRFTKDIYAIDELVPNAFVMYVSTFFTVVSSIGIITFVNPFFIFVAIPLFIFYFFVQQYFLPTSKQLQRIEATLMSPVLTMLNETVEGSSVIRAFKKENFLVKENFEKVDSNCKAFYLYVSANRWLAVRLEMVGTFVASFTGLLCVLSRGNLASGMSGVAICYALNITQNLNWLLRTASDLETNLVSVERLNEFIHDIPREDGPKARKEVSSNSRYKQDTNRLVCSTFLKEPYYGWPNRGEISFFDFSAGYSNETVLHNLTFSIKSGEKVAIVGRTGAGKSTVLLSVLRFLEAKTGSIVVDGVNLSELKVQSIRRNFSIIPQDPILFAGTVRKNLDPFAEYTDVEIWRATEQCHLQPHLYRMNPEKNGVPFSSHNVQIHTNSATTPSCAYTSSIMESCLNINVEEGGKNFSVGQRQLLCLGRALLRRSKILLLDEATAVVDPFTDSLIQSTIFREFSDCTILTIAHRIHTILGYDRVMVLSNGKIEEFDAVHTLFQNPNGMFRSLCNESGIHHLTII